VKIKFAELTNGSIKQRSPGRLKWGDIVLKKGASPVDASALQVAPPGSDFILESQAGGDPATIAELRAAASAQESFVLLLTGTSNAAAQKIVEEHLGIRRITIKQCAASAAFGIEIRLRKG